MNDDAILNLPSYLLVVVIITTLLFTVLIQGVLIFKEQSQLKEMERAIEHIISSAEYLTTHGKQGSRIAKTIAIPSCINFVSFGLPPTQIIKKMGFENKSSFPSNIYVICYTDGRIEFEYVDFSFASDHPLDSYLLSEGSHKLFIEIIELQGNTYVRFSI